MLPLVLLPLTPHPPVRLQVRIDLVRQLASAAALDGTAVDAK